MIGVSATTDRAGTEALRDPNVAVVLRIFGKGDRQAGVVYVITVNDGVAEKVRQARPGWIYTKGSSHAFETRFVLMDTVVALLAVMLPGIEKWETR